MHLRPTLLVIALSGAVVPAASANTIVYNDLASFQAVSTTSNINFGGLVPAGHDFYGPFTQLTLGDVTFFGPELFVVNADDLLCCHFPASTAPATLFDDTPGPGLAYHAAFGTSVTALGFDIANSCAPGCSENGGNITVGFSDGFTDSFASTGNFMGFTSDTPISFLDISSSGYMELTNFRSGDADDPVPEPASMVLLGTGLAGAGMRCWRKRRIAA